MNKLTQYIAFFFLIIVFPSCGNNDAEKNNIDELAIIKKLSQNDFYKDFFPYNIRPREEEWIYMIETDSIKEFWVEYDKDDGVTFYKDADKKEVEEKLKTIYPNNYLEIKETYISDLNNLIPFMVSNGIKAVVHFTSKRIDFSLAGGHEIIWLDKSSLNEVVKSFRRFYNIVTVIDSNWVILKDEKLQ